MSVPKSNAPNPKSKSPRPAKDPSREEHPEPREDNEWLHELAEQERERTAELLRFKTAAASFFNTLYERILADVASFRTEFPGTAIQTKIDTDQGFLEVVNQSCGAPAPEVRVSTNSANQTLLLTFEFRPSLNKELPMRLEEDKLIVDLPEHNSIATLSRIALTPVLFPELTSSTLLYQSLSELSRLQ